MYIYITMPTLQQYPILKIFHARIFKNTFYRNPKVDNLKFTLFKSVTSHVNEIGRFLVKQRQKYYSAQALEKRMSAPRVAVARATY